MSLSRMLGCVLGLLTLVACSRAGATVFFAEPFSYDNGDLTAATGSAWVAHNSSTPTIQVADGMAVLAQPGGEDVNRPANASLPTGSTWYYGAKLIVNDTRATPGTGSLTNLYFMHFSDGGTINFRGRALVSPGDSEANFKFGIVSSSSGTPPVPAAKWATDLTFGTEYTIIVGYTAADSDPADAPDGYSDLWVNPVNSGSTKISDTTSNSNVTSDLTSPMSAWRFGSKAVAAGPVNILVDVVSIGDSFAEVLAALSPAPANNADFNSDGIVDGADYLIWQKGNGLTDQTGKTNGNANTDTVVDGLDLAVWQTKFGGCPPWRRPAPCQNRPARRCWQLDWRPFVARAAGRTNER